MRPYTPYIPKTTGELWDLLGSMMLSSPTFIDSTGYFPDRNIDTTFFALNESLKLLRGTLGEENYLALAKLSNQMRAHFEADPEDVGEETLKGRDCILAMEDVLRAARRKKV